jgi:hypothetical protein
MSRPSLVSRFLRAVGGKQQRPRRRAFGKLRLEPLEDRLVPSALTVNLVNNTGLPDNAVSVVMAGGTQHYDGANWVANPAGGVVTSTPLSSFSGEANHRASVTVPAGLDGGIIDLFLGTNVNLVSAPNQRVGSPSPYDRQPGTGNAIPPFQLAEFSTNGGGNTQFAIDLSNVDQWSVPAQLSLQSQPQTTFGTNLTQQALFDKFNSGLTGDFRQLIITNNSQPMYVANPRKFLDVTPNAALNQYFDPDLKALFQTGTNNLNLTVSGVTWTGVREPDPFRPGAFRLAFTNPANSKVYVYEPGMNGIANPSWNDQGESSGKQVFGGDGVFNDAGRQSGVANVGALADIEQQLNAALNRGVANLDSSQWLNFAVQYQSGDYNQYAKILHDNFINNRAYGFSEDEQGFASVFALQPLPDTATITLGPSNSPPTVSTGSTKSAANRRGPIEELIRLAKEEFALTLDSIVALAEMAVGIHPSPALQNSIDANRNAMNANPQDHTPLGAAVSFVTWFETLNLLQTDVNSLTSMIPA